jgi:hypothetical protein
MTSETARRVGEYQLPAHARNTYCKSCGCPIVWAKTGAGRAIPLSLRTVAHRDGERYALTHYADCPQSREWRGHGATAPTAATAAADGASYAAAYRERYRLSDGTLPLAWWLIGRTVTSSSAPELSAAELAKEAAQLAASQIHPDDE